MLAQRADRADPQPSFSRERPRPPARRRRAARPRPDGDPRRRYLPVPVSTSRSATWPRPTCSHRGRSPTRATLQTEGRPRRGERGRRAAIRLHARQGRRRRPPAGAAFDRAVAPVDPAFDVATPDADRVALLETALPGLTDESRANLMALPPSRWTAIRTEMLARPRPARADELRDADAGRGPRLGSPAGSSAALNGAERELGGGDRSVRCSSPNSTYDDDATEAGSRRRAAAVAPAADRCARARSSSGAATASPPTWLEEIDAPRSRSTRSDFARLGGWLLLAALARRPAAGLGAGASGRSFWHRNNALLLSACCSSSRPSRSRLTGDRAGAALLRARPPRSGCC